MRRILDIDVWEVKRISDDFVDTLTKE